MNPAISVIVPVYNVEAYVRKSLQSIADQTFTDWECIVVDDGSTDGSGAICDEFAACDPRFRVIHQSNMGLSGARNTGLAVAQGRYIGFLDSDDYIHPDMYQVLLTVIEQTGADIAIVSTRQVANMDECFRPNPPIKYRLMNCEQAFYYWFVKPFGQAQMEMVWNKLYRRELIGDELFADVVPAEDREFNIRMCLRSHTVVRANQVLHHWLVRMGSLSRWGSNDRTCAEHRLFFFIAHKLCERHCSAMNKQERGCYYTRLMKLFLAARYAARHQPDIMQKILAYGGEVLSNFLRNDDLPFKYRLIMRLMYHFPWLYSAFIRFFELKARLINRP